MALSRLEINPTMDQSTMAQAINDNFRQIESENRTQIIRDDKGDNRIIIGKFPDGSYGLAISIDGVDVVKALEE